MLVGQVQIYSVQILANAQNSAFQTANTSSILGQCNLSIPEKSPSQNITKAISSTQQPQSADKLKPCHVFSFGDQINELSILESQDSIIQAATLTNCEFVALSKKNYVQILKDIEQEKLDSNLSFFKMTSYFENWTDENIKNIYVNTKVIEFQKNQPVYLEGAPANCVYIVKEGTFVKMKKKISQFN